MQIEKIRKELCFGYENQQNILHILLEAKKLNHQKTMIEFFIHMPFQEFLIRGKSIKHIETFMIFVFL